MKLLVLSLIVFGSFRVVELCSNTANSASEDVQCTFLNVASSRSGASSVSVVDGDEINCPRLIDGDLADNALDGDQNSNAQVKIVFARPYLVDTIRITESEDTAESGSIELEFSDGSKEQLTLTAGSYDPDEISFTPRVTSWIELVETSKYEDGAARFTEIEIYYDACQKEKVCDYYELKLGDKVTSTYLLTDTLSFMKNSTADVNLEFYNSIETLIYRLRVGDKVRLRNPSDDVAGPAHVPGAAAGPHWMPFWVDMRNSSRMLVGTGTTQLLDYDFGGADAPVYGKFVLRNPASHEDNIVFCDHKVSCYVDAIHYWPLDKLVTYDVIAKRYGIADGALSMNVDGPSLVLGKRTSVLLKDGFIDLGLSTTCVDNLNLCTEGMSVSVWLKIESLADKTSYYVTGGSPSAGFAIFSPGAADRVDPNNVVEIVFQNVLNKWHVSVLFALGDWHHIGCSWHPLEGLYCLIDLSTVLKGVESLPAFLFGSLGLGKSSVVPDSFGHASFSSLALWDKKLTSSDLQALYYCMGLNPRSKASDAFGISSYKLPDESFSASSYTEEGAPYFARNALGGWVSQVLDSNQFLQIDLLALMEIHSLEMYGNSDLGAYVKTFTLSQSKNAIAWVTYKTDNGSTKVFEGNKDSSSSTTINLDKYMVTRYLRINPASYQGSIVLKVEIFGKQTSVNYLGCFPIAAVIDSDLLMSDSIPFDCTILCGHYNKPYALLHDGGRCYCPESLLTGSAVSDLFCEVPCKNTKVLTCGGKNHAAAFAVLEFNNQTFQLVAPMWTKESASFNLTFSSSASAAFLVFTDDEVIPTEMSNLPILFHDSGYKSYVVEATTGQYLQKTSLVQRDIFVALRAKRLTFTCPKLVVASQTYECVLEGCTGVFDVFNYTINAELLESPSLPGSFIGAVGGVHHPTAKADETQKGVLLVNSFVESAIVSYIELHAQKGGSLKLQIYRPVCGSGPFREYCDINNICTYFHPICEEMSSYACPDSNVLHLPTGQCLVQNSLDCIGKTNMPRFIPQKYRKYELIYETEIVLNIGVNTYILSDQETVNVREGDVFGVSYPKENASSLSVETIDGYEVALDLPNSYGIVRGDYIEASGNVQVIHIQHSVKVKYFIPQRKSFTFSLPPGVYHAAIALDNNVNEFGALQTIVSGTPLKGASWRLGAIISTHSEYSITVQVTAGTNVTYVVTYDDGTVDEVFLENSPAPLVFKHAYASPGYKFLELHVFNYFLEEVTNHMLLVQDIIKDVNLTSPVKPTNFTAVTSIDWYIDSGSRANIEIDLGDGTTFSNESVDIHGVVSRPIRHVYPNPIEFWINITAYNLVSRVELYFMIIVEIPIVKLQSRVIHANRDIEVNETVLIELSQLNGTNVIHYFQFQDGSTLLTRETNIHKNYSYWAMFPVNITAWNNVSWTTWIQDIKVHKPIRDLTGFAIATSPTNHTDPVRFDFDMVTGSDFNCTWNFDDGKYGKSDFWITDGEVYKWPITHQVMYHMYAGIGVYNVRINCTNRLYNTTASTVSIVQVPISLFDVDQPPPQPNDENLVVDFRAATGTNISYVVTFYHSWERQPIVITNVTISPDTLNGLAVIAKEHFTNRVALYEVKITAINLVTPLQVVKRTVVVDRPIRDAYIVIHALYVETNVTVNYTVYADASNVTITWNFDDTYAPTDKNFRTNWFRGVYSPDGWTVWHKFINSGIYTIIVHLSNSLGSVTVRKEVIGQFGVYLRTVTDSPRPLPPGRLNFSFIPRPEQHHPTNAQMVVEFGDGANYTGPYNSTIIHLYKGWGIFTANCTIMNRISWGFFEFVVEIQRVIQGLKLTPFHTGGDAGYFGPGRGQWLDHLPLEYDVLWNVTATDGTNMTFTYDFGDGGSAYTQIATVFHKYSTVAYFTGKVHATNAVSEAWAEFIIRIQQIVVGLDVASDCPRKLADKTSFRVTIEQVGTESCYLLKFGNNSENYLFKDDPHTVCEPTFLNLSNKIEIFSGNSFNVTYTYRFIDVYSPRLIGSNLVSKIWKFHKAVVVHDHCRYPKVDVFNIGRNTTLAPSVLRSQVFMVDTQNTIICAASKTTSFFWEVFLVNPVKGTNDTLVSLPPTVAVTNPRYRIDPRTLPYGSYKMRFTITMLGVNGVLGFDDAFLKIVESPMIATVAGGTGLAKGVRQNLTLDASQCHDPDVGPRQYENITIRWECEAVNVPAGTTYEEAGCSVGDFQTLREGNAEDLVSLGTDFAKLPKIVYSLKLMVWKNDRRVFIYFNLYTEPNDMLTVHVKCLQNCKKKRVTAVKMAYMGGIKDLGDPEALKKVEYEWKLYKSPEIGRLGRIEEQTWEEISNFADMVATTTDADTVVISEKMLWPASRYRLRLYVTFNGQQGFAEEELYINQPPSGGGCSIEPSEGYALDTDFRVKCWGWSDKDMPLSYKFAYKTSAKDFESLIYFGSKSETPPIKLPLGKSFRNYSVMIIVDTADSFLAANLSVLNVTVHAKPITDLAQFENENKNMISVDGPLGNAMASGDAHKAAQLITSLSSVLDDQAANTNSSGGNSAQSRIEMRNVMDATISSIPIDSIEAIREKAAASAMISNTPNEATAEMQDSQMNSAMEMIAFMANSTTSDEPPNPQDTFNAAGGLISTLGNAMEASIITGAANTSSDTVAEGNVTEAGNVSKALVQKAMENTEKLANAVLSQKFAGEPATEVVTDRLSMAVQRANPSSFGKTPASTGGGSFLTPDAGTLFGLEGNDTSGMSAVDVKAVSNTKNPFAWDDSASQVKSKVMTMEMKNASGHPIKISNLSKPIDMWVPRGVVVDFSAYTINHGIMLYRAFTVVQNDTSIQIEIIPEDNNTELIAYLRFGAFPKENIYDFKFLVPKVEYAVESVNGSNSSKTNTRQINPFILFRSNVDLNRTAARKYYVGIKYNGTFEPVYEAKISGAKVLYEQYIPPTANFTMRTFTSSCLYFDTDDDTWKSDGCTVGPKTCMEGTQCLCTHLTSFGGDMVVAPNTIDWSAISLDNLFSNPIVFAVVMSFIFIYVVLLIPARRQDKKDLEKLGVVPLLDNDPRDCYSYEITVYTGFSAEAGSTAQIYFILQGSQDETPVRVLKDPSKDKFSVGSISYFLLTVPSSLGKLKNLRIWHDNGGRSPSWYLLRIMIHDIQRDTKTWFLCDRWLAVEEDDGEIERNLRLANAEDLTKFNFLFQTEARKNLSDGHIWISVIKRPARSNFTRVQRLSCCLCILLTTMLANAMFYQNDPSSSGAGVLKVGPMSFSLQQLSIAVTSSLVVLPVNLFVVYIFRNARPKRNTKNRKSSSGVTDPEKRPTQSGKKSDEKQGKKKSSLPHWMVYVAYVLIFIACSVSATFTVFYGLTFGKAKSEAWISAMMISFWQDVLVSQPLKVFAAATLFALLTKDPKKATGEDKEDTMPSPELQQDEEFATKRNVPGGGLMSMARIDPKPPDPQTLQASRELRLKQRQMKLIIYDIIWYFIFVTVLLSVAHGNKDRMAYETTSTMSSLFEENSYTNWISLSEVSDAKLYWYWSRQSLLPTLIPNQWYGPNQYLENVVWVSSDPQISRSRGARSRLHLSRNKQRKLQGRPEDFPDTSFALNGTTNYPVNYIADHATDYTVGVARYRQLRVKPNQCTIHPAFRHMFQECNSYYSWEKEDEGRYFAGWTLDPSVQNESDTNKKQKNAWQYNTAWELKGTPYWAGFSTYWGGGFVADLGHNQTLAMNMTAYLQNNNWLDRYTRAIFIEFTIYNPNVNMFCLITLLTEIIPTGAYYQFNKIYPLRLYRYFGPNLMAIMVLEITLMTFLLYFAYREFKKWRREGRLYWRDIWTYMELLVLAACFSTIGLYFARMVATNYSIGLMREDPTRFVSFHYAAALDQWSTFTLGMAVFLAFLKTLRLLRFNRRMSIMGKSLKICAKPLASFFIVYLVVFLAYAALGFLVFGRVATDYHTFQSSMANVLGMTLGAFNFHALVEAHFIIGPVFFFTFTFVVNFILINVFVAIICEALATVTSDTANQSNDHEMLDFMVHEFKAFVGQRVSPSIKPVYKESLSELEENFDQIEKKGEKVEMALRNMCMEEIRHMSWFHPENCPKKKKLLVRLLLHAQQELTETDICDAIPLLDEVLATYTERDIKDWLGEYTGLDETGSCRSSILFSCTTLRDSDEESDERDEDSDNESLREGIWSELSGGTNLNSSPSIIISENQFFAEHGAGDAKSGSVECYYRYHNRRPSTAERFCRTATTISMTSLNDNMADIDQMLADVEGERLFIEESEEQEDTEGHTGTPRAYSAPSGGKIGEEADLEMKEEENEEEERKNKNHSTAWAMTPTPRRAEQNKSFQPSFSPRQTKHEEHVTVEELDE